jgi:large-conductance mechanosensitive channel
VKQAAPRYTFSEAILAALIGAIIYCVVCVLLSHGTRDFIGRFIAWLKIVLPIAMIGLPLVGVPLARGLKRIRQDGVLQGMALGAFIGALVCFVVVSTMAFIVIKAEDSSAALGAVLLHGLKASSGLYLIYGAPGGALAALLFMGISQLRTQQRPILPVSARIP